MKRIHDTANLGFGGELERVVEPLASYICATGRPRTALKLALAALSSQIEATNRSATSQVAAFLERPLATPAC